MQKTPQDTVLAIPSDTHSGSSVGLMPPGQWEFANGGYHNPDETQRILTRLWITAWERIGKARRGKRLVIVHNGDATEGQHHGSLEVITPRVDEQERMHVESMELAMALANFDASMGDLLYYVKGTPAHVMNGGMSEERIARQFEDTGIQPRRPPSEPGGKDGRFVWDRLRMDVNGKLFDIAHHGAGLGTKPWTKTNPLRSKLQEVYWRNLENKTRAPDYWVRSHRHVKAHDVYVAATGQRIEGHITPAMQNKTEFGYKVAADIPASLGVIWFDISASGAVRFDEEYLETETEEVIRL